MSFDYGDDGNDDLEFERDENGERREKKSNSVPKPLTLEELIEQGEVFKETWGGFDKTPNELEAGESPDFIDLFRYMGVGQELNKRIHGQFGDFDDDDMDEDFLPTPPIPNSTNDYPPPLTLADDIENKLKVEIKDLKAEMDKLAEENQRLNQYISQLEESLKVGQGIYAERKPVRQNIYEGE